MPTIEATKPSVMTAQAILRRVLAHSRRSSIEPGCPEKPCTRCADVHLDHVTRLVAAGRPIEFALPAFPTKSPNPAKVLGIHPDLAEELALRFLADLCRDIEKIYAPGAAVVICSDGRVFEKLIKVSDDVITTYQRGIRELVDRIDPSRLRLFTLEEEWPGLTHDEMRAEVDRRYGESLDELRTTLKSDDHGLATYRGIVRFLLDDVWHEDYRGSRSALQRDCRARAYAVVARSRAWGRLVDQRFPDAVRLSIHPQPCGSPKIGIMLAATDDVWLTPWHAVAVRRDDAVTLMKRAEARAAGARLITVDGRPSHYQFSSAPVPQATRYVTALRCAQ